MLEKYCISKTLTILKIVISKVNTNFNQMKKKMGWAIKVRCGTEQASFHIKKFSVSLIFPYALIFHPEVKDKSESVFRVLQLSWK